MPTPPTSNPAPAPRFSRLVSLDALRGFDMFWILGADGVAHALPEMNHWSVIAFLARQLEHTAWSGLTFYDLIFPLFVFIVGVSTVFSLEKTIAQHGRSAAVRRICVRTVLLFAFGVFYNGGLAAEWPGVRLAGVLQRIGLAYAAAGLLFCFCRPRTLAAVAAAMLVGYWVLLTFVPIRALPLEKAALEARLGPAEPEPKSWDGRPNAEYLARVQTLFDETTVQVNGGYEPGLNLTNHLDFQFLPGRMYDIYWDPEGLLSTIPAVATCLLGVFAGLLLARTDLSQARKLSWLLAAGAAALVVGHLWGLQFPIVKKIWTSSFVLVTGGWSLLLLGAFYYVVDMRQWRQWCEPFVWIGMNPITLYLATSLVGFHGIARRFVGGDIQAFLDNHLAEGLGGLVVTLTVLLLLVLLARFLYQRKIFLRV